MRGPGVSNSDLIRLTAFRNLRAAGAPHCEPIRCHAMRLRDPPSAAINMLKINFCLGAHKTATTFLQEMLAANRDELNAHGVALAVPADLRKEWLPAFLSYTTQRSSSPDTRPPEGLAAIAPPDGTLILSEENIIGVPNDLSHHRGLYPFARQRISALASVFPGASIRFFFSIRSYETFYRSAYSEILRNRGFIPFDQFYDPARYRKNSWTGVVAEMARVIPENQITLWCYEDFRQLSPTIISMLTDGMDAAPMVARYGKKTARPSLSRKTIAILGDLSPVLSRDESRRFAKRLAEAYPVRTADDEYRPFSKKTETVMRKQYRADVLAIRERFPNVRFLEPPTKRFRLSSLWKTQHPRTPS